MASPGGCEASKSTSRQKFILLFFGFQDGLEKILALMSNECQPPSWSV